jgi:hypothetical protein
MPSERMLDESCVESGDGEADEDETEAAMQEGLEYNEKAIPHIKIGDSIGYKLRPDQRPTNPLRIYHGLVTDVLSDGIAMLVTLLDPEYDGLSETVFLKQVVEVRRPGGE